MATTVGRGYNFASFASPSSTVSGSGSRSTSRFAVTSIHPSTPNAALPPLPSSAPPSSSFAPLQFPPLQSLREFDDESFASFSSSSTSTATVSALSFPIAPLTASRPRSSSFTLTSSSVSFAPTASVFPPFSAPPAPPASAAAAASPSWLISSYSSSALAPPFPSATAMSLVPYQGTAATPSTAPSGFPTASSAAAASRVLRNPASTTILVYGFVSSVRGMVLSRFQRYGEITHFTAHGNWISLQYRESLSAQNALSQHRRWWSAENADMLIAVEEVDPAFQSELETLAALNGRFPSSSSFSFSASLPSTALLPSAPAPLSLSLQQPPSPFASVNSALTSNGFPPSSSSCSGGGVISADPLSVCAPQSNSSFFAKLSDYIFHW